MRKYKPVELDLAEPPVELLGERARCPNCLDARATRVIGLLGRRPVFLCEKCRVRFHRQPAATRGAL